MAQDIYRDADEEPIPITTKHPFPGETLTPVQDFGQVQNTGQPWPFIRIVEHAATVERVPYLESLPIPAACSHAHDLFSVAQAARRRQN